MKKHYETYSLLDDSFRSMLTLLEGERVDSKVAKHSLNALRARIANFVHLYEDLMIEGREDMNEKANQVFKVIDNMLEEIGDVDEIVPMEGELRDCLVQLNATLGAFVLYIQRSELMEKVSDRLSLQLFLTERIQSIEDKMNVKIGEVERRLKRLEDEIKALHRTLKE